MGLMKMNERSLVKKKMNERSLHFMRGIFYGIERREELIFLQCIAEFVFCMRVVLAEKTCNQIRANIGYCQWKQRAIKF